jgi:hypothetical protein
MSNASDTFIVKTFCDVESPALDFVFISNYKLNWYK